MISNPVSNSGLYARSDKMQMEYIPRETFEGSGEYKIYTYYQVNRLQALLKTDFYRALEAGFIIRKCEYCGRCFLLKKAYHTKYCDNPAPDDPKAQSLRRCLIRIEKDCERNIITSEEKELLTATAKDMYHSATTRSGISNEEFEESLASKNYTLNAAWNGKPNVAADQSTEFGTMPAVK